MDLRRFGRKKVEFQGLQTWLYASYASRPSLAPLSSRSLIMPLYRSMPPSDSEVSDSSNEQRDPVLRPPLTPEEIRIVEGLRDAFKQIDAPICCFGHVPFETSDPKISYCTTPPLATEGSLDLKPQTEG